MTVCEKCGSFVTPQFARVFGDNDDHVYGCPTCTAVTEILDGAATQPDAEAGSTRP
jgi:hypothetical protein